MNNSNICQRIMVALCLLLAGCNVFSPKTVLGMTCNEEEKLAKEFMQMARRQYEFIHDTFNVAYVNKVGHKITIVLEARPLLFD